MNNLDVQTEIDRLKASLKSAKHDSATVAAWMDWDRIIYHEDPKLDYMN